MIIIHGVDDAQMEDARLPGLLGSERGEPDSESGRRDAGRESLSAGVRGCLDLPPIQGSDVQPASLRLAGRIRPGHLLRG
jgi:hypothetical protein